MTNEIVLSVDAIDAHYGHIQALRGVSLEVKRGQLVALLGANGAGKSTVLRTISGLVRATAGRVDFLGEDIASTPAHRLPYRGLVHVPEGRRIFGGMTILENLDLGSFVLRDDAERKRRLDNVFGLFPILAERARQDASLLSGGQQQMLAIGRALMASPKLLLLDEPSMGLAPLMVKEVMQIVERLHRQGVTILLVEQNSKVALKYADYAYVLDSGRIALQGTSDELLRDDLIIKTYLGSPIS
ncbi:ABC transporter ATP-binding protein [Bosea vestrisii]|uniref:ABC transporter ATP-binding protein n=1 Tax=Bosea vestrisii TaxID=151416 RepID=UPI0024E0286E|nr:ABC transporter ATP-binding protein [Bosea vestrisii]WID95209.1 ABC transporter ATP-binding protein [Bosea vestrisii]